MLILKFKPYCRREIDRRKKNRAAQKALRIAQEAHYGRRLSGRQHVALRK